MNGIAGVWNLDARPIEGSVLRSMSARLRHRGRDGERLHVSGATGIACQHSWVTPEEQGEHQPLIGASGAVLVMDGRIDNRDELIAALGLDRSTSDARCVLTAYEAWADGFAERLNGDFALAILDVRAGASLAGARRAGRSAALLRPYVPSVRVRIGNQSASRAS